MKRAMSRALLMVGAALAIAAASAMPASAATSGSETLSGTSVFAPAGTTARTVISSVVVAKGAFGGVGRFVEVVPGDPVSQDYLVFPSGTLYVVATLGSLSPGSSLTPGCLFRGTQQLTWQVTGGSGQFKGATGTFTGTVSTEALLARNPDGSCSFTQVPRHEVDKFAESGTLSFLR